LKIVWLCHFSNQEIQDILNPRKRIGEMAPWITALSRLFEGNEEIELHIVSPYEYINGYKQFSNRGIHYHFFNAHIPFWGRHWPGIFKFDYWSDFTFSKLKVKRIINKIDPDIVHLHGAENAYYSSSILQFKYKYPVLITVQGFISLTSDKESYQLKKRREYEQKILKTFKHIGYRTQTMGRDIKKFNPHAVLHWQNYPINEIKLFNSEKKYDVVFFARVTKEKGIEDLLKAISITKRDKPDISLCIIGGANEKYLNYLKNITIELDISENVYWAGFLPEQTDVHKLACTARISVLPPYSEIISGTIIESLFLKLPVVAYNVGSIHEVNEKEEIISLVSKGNVEGLAQTILGLLKDENMRTEKAENGYKRAKVMFDNSKIFVDLLNAYREVINDFKRE